jgi:hypothetical protein
MVKKPFSDSEISCRDFFCLPIFVVFLNSFKDFTKKGFLLSFL